MVKPLLVLATFLSITGLAGPVVGAHLAGVHWTLDFVGVFLLPAMSVLIVIAAILGIRAFARRPRRGPALLAAYAVVTAACGLPHLGTGLAPAALPLTGAQATGAEAVNPSPTSRAAHGGPGGRGVKIYQHNVWINNARPVAVADQIRRLDPDIAVLVETPLSYSTGPVLDTLRDTWPFEVRDAPAPARQARARILSKLPIVASDLFRTPSGLSVVWAQVETQAGPLTVIGAHFSRPWPFNWPMIQVEQLQDLKRVHAQATCPCVVLGDFNSPPWGRLARELRRDVGLRALNLGWRGTWHADMPIWAGIPIDLTFLSRDLNHGDLQILSASGSDHRAIAFTVVPR